MTANEPSAATRKFQKELNAGAVSLVLLGVMGRAREPLYGYQIAKQLEGGREGVTMMKQGALYPVLRSLEKNGLLESRVEPSSSGPPRRYYEITDAGREALEQWTTIWHHNRRFVDAVLKGNYDV
ncbi:PadR family transcriptional regulator [bacterium]|nr:PadR family transcriptional regulator [bacterium]